jgi:hypothetical protein
MSENETPPPPDITKDPLLVIFGVSVIAGNCRMGMHDRAHSVATLVNMEPLQSPDPFPPDFYPEEIHFSIGHDLLVGTVDQLTDAMRQALTAGWEALACKQPDGTYGVIDLFGEASLRKQTKALSFFKNDNSSTGRAIRIGALPPEVLDAQERMRNEIHGFAPTQTAAMRDTLCRLCLQFELLQGNITDVSSVVPLPPDANVRALISALTAYADDNEDYRRHLSDEVAGN